PTVIRIYLLWRDSAGLAGRRRRRSGHRDLPPRVEPHARVLRAGALAQGPDRAHPRLPLRPLHRRRRPLHALSFIRQGQPERRRVSRTPSTNLRSTFHIVASLVDPRTIGSSLTITARTAPSV